MNKIKRERTRCCNQVSVPIAVTIITIHYLVKCGSAHSLYLFLLHHLIACDLSSRTYCSKVAKRRRKRSRGRGAGVEVGGRPPPVPANFRQGVPPFVPYEHAAQPHMRRVLLPHSFGQGINSTQKGGERERLLYTGLCTRIGSAAG